MIDDVETIGEWECESWLDGTYEVSQNDNPLPIGDYKVTRISFNTNLDDYPDEVPTAMRVEFADCIRTGNIKTIATNKRVKLVNGKTEKIDEITLYILAEVS